MAFPDTPRKVALEMFLNGVWTNIMAAAKVFARDNVIISRGRRNEGGLPEPSALSATLNNDSGDFNEFNPVGAYYGSLGLGTPVRLLIPEIARDLFSRVVAGGWGTSDSAHVWTTTLGAGGTVAAADYAVTGSRATMSVPVANGYRLALLETLGNLRDVDFTASVTLPFTDVLGAAVYPCCPVLRGASVTDWVYAAVAVATNETVSIAIYHFDGTVIAAPYTVPGLVHTSAQELSVRAQAEGHTFRAKVWVTSAGEPYDWQVRGHFTRNAAPGFVGLMHLVATGNTNTKPIVSSLDNVEVRSPRFHGELASLRPQWDLSENDRWAYLEAAGIMRRLGQGQSPILSPGRRRINYILGTAVGQPYIKNWWPLEDGADVIRGRVEEVLGTTVKPVAWSSSVSFGGSTDAPGASAAVTVSQSVNYIDLPVTPGAVSTAWAVALTAQCGTNEAGTVYFIASGPNSGELFSLRLVIGADGVAYVLRSFQTIGGIEDTIISSTVRAGGWIDHDWHHYIVVCRQSGADVVVELWVDGAQVATHTSASVTIRALHTVQPYTGTPYVGPMAVSHVVILTGAPSSWHADTVDAISDACLGHRGERAGDRLLRLCAEENIPFSYTGELSDTPEMGPQATDTLLNNFRACEAADRGTLADPKGDTGFYYRTRKSMYTQDVTLALDYLGEHISPPLDPQNDDQGIRNDVRVKRTNGGEVRVTLDVGRRSTLDPSLGGAGRRDTSAEVNVYSDAQILGIAFWIRALGTVCETRFPRVRVSLFNSPMLESEALNVALDDRATIDNLPPDIIPDQVTQLIRGYVESLNDYDHDLIFTCEPESPYRVGIVGQAGHQVDAADSSLTGGPYSSGATSLTVATAGGGRWVTGAVSIDLDIAGEQVRVTNITGATSPQTFTVTRSLNGVVKGQVSGNRVRLARPVKVGLG